jgi:nucleoside phosphorylase
MSSSRFEAFSEACIPVAGATACEKFAAYLRGRGRGQRLLPERIALDLVLEEEDLDDLLTAATAVGLLELCPQVRCPHCNARLDLNDLLTELEQEGVASCPDCREMIGDPRSLRPELRYRLAADADAEVAAEQAEKASLPRMRAVILTALPVELAAVHAQLKTGGEVQSNTIAGGQIHLTGTFQDEHVTWEIACALSEQGNSAAAAALANAINDFEPDVAIFVGVAGGIAAKGAVIGDVVAGTRLIAYEGGKDAKDGLQPRPFDLPSSFDLRQIAAHMLLDEAWQQRILTHEPTITQTFKAHVEPIATGSKLVVSSASQTARLLEQVAQRAVAVEMEGAGFLEAASRSKALSAIVVRGISDLLDGKAEADRGGSQRQASANAAAFAFELLARFQPPP